MRIQNKYSDPKQQEAFFVGVRAGMKDLETIKKTIFDWGVSKGWEEAAEYLMEEHKGCQEDTLVSYHIASDVVKLEGKTRGLLK